MYYDIICQKLGIMVAKYYFRTWICWLYGQVSKNDRLHCHFSFNNKCFIIIEDIKFIFVVVHEIIKKQEC